MMVSTLINELLHHMLIRKNEINKLIVNYLFVHSLVTILADPI